MYVTWATMLSRWMDGGGRVPVFMDFIGKAQSFALDALMLKITIQYRLF